MYTLVPPAFLFMLLQQKVRLQILTPPLSGIKASIFTAKKPSVIFLHRITCRCYPVPNRVQIHFPSAAAYHAFSQQMQKAGVSLPAKQIHLTSALTGSFRIPDIDLDSAPVISPVNPLNL
jgi:hypothetical protein